MNLESNLRSLTDHMTWADSKLWQTIHRIENIEIDDRVKELFYHIHVVQQVYYQMWTGKEILFPDLPELHSLADVMKWGRENSINAAEHVREMDAARFGKILSNPWKDQLVKVLGRTPNDATVSESIIQVATHSCYHRAQINTYVRELGGEPAKIDFITWVWLGKPAPEWESIFAS